MDAKRRNAILKEDFDRVDVKDNKFTIWVHKKAEVYAVVPKKEKEQNKIIFVHCSNWKDEFKMWQDAFKKAFPFGVKFTYNTEQELMTYIIGICENQ